MTSLTADVTDTAREQDAGAGRGAGATLSEPEIVEAALRVVRQDGVAKLSMRRLSRELGVSPMAPYYYVADKRELLDLVASAALAGVNPPPSDAGPWQDRLRQMIDQIDERLRKYPGLGDVLIEGIMRRQLDLIAGIMDILFEAGFSDRDVLVAYATVHTFLFGRGRLEPARPEALNGLPLPQHVLRATDHLADLRGKYFYDFGAATVIAGLEAQLTRRPAATAEVDITT